MSDAIDEARFDPLSEAERVTGESHKDDALTMRLGMSLAFAHNARKAELLKSTSDSHYGMSYTDALALFGDLGFEVVLRDEFAGRDGVDEFVVLWHPDGLFAMCESYGKSLNTSSVLYNYRHPEGYPPGRLTSSGGMRHGVWVGHHDAREGIRHNLTAMRAEGAFLAQWVEQPFLWLLTYTDTDVDGYDYDAITAERVSRLPKHVRVAIAGDA